MMTATYYTTKDAPNEYVLTDGTTLQAAHNWQGKWLYTAVKDGKTSGIKNLHAYVALINQDVARRAMPEFLQATTPEQICAASQLIYSENGRIGRNEVDYEETYKTPDGRTYKVTRSKDVGNNAITAWGYAT